MSSSACVSFRCTLWSPKELSSAVRVVVLGVPFMLESPRGGFPEEGKCLQKLTLLIKCGLCFKLMGYSGLQPPIQRQKLFIVAYHLLRGEWDSVIAPGDSLVT